ncbi:MAG: ABC transporter permease [Sphingomonadales bacterium]
MNDFYLIYKNLTRKKLRLFLTCFSIFIAFLIFGTILALKSALDSGVELSAADRLLTFNSINFTNPLPISYVNKIRAVEGVNKVTHANWFGGYYQEPANQTMTMAVDPETYLEVYEEIVLSPEQKEGWFKNRQGVIVGDRIAKANGWKVGDRIPISSNIYSQKNAGNTWDFVVEGVFKGKDEQFDTGFLAFHYKYFMETQSYGGDMIGWIILTTDDSSLNEKVARTIDDLFSNSQSETDTSTEKAFAKAFVAQIGNIGLIIFGVVFMAFFTILIVVGNTMVLAIRERTGEIAVLKTLGFTSKRIFKMVLAESILLSLLGGLSGLGGAFLLVASGREVMAQFLPNLSISYEIILQAILYMLLLGLITGIIPAMNALKLNVITAFSRR